MELCAIHSIESIDKRTQIEKMINVPQVPKGEILDHHTLYQQ
jgi:hypothetical protein